MIDAIDITTGQRKTILKMLKKYLPGTAVWAYGSRVKWTSRPESDLDIVVFSSPNQKRQVSDLKEALEECDLPFRVDLFIWDEVPEGFRKNIEAEHVVLQEQSESSQVVRTEWKTSKLEDCMEAIIDYRGKTPKKTTSGVPLVTAKIIKRGTILPVTEYIAEQDYDSWMRRGIPQTGDVVMTTEAPLGEIAQLDSRKVALAQRVITLRGKRDELENTFMKYLMLSTDVQNQLIARSTGTTVKGIKQKELREIELTYPDYSTQRAIAHILGSLDDKIELNRQMNRILEKMAQAVFKSWFIDFDPVRAKAEAHDTGLPKDIAELFPDSFEDSRLGQIPKGWALKRVSSLLDINPRLILSKGKMARYVDMKALSTSGFSVTDVIEKEFKGGAKFQQHDVLLARITPCLENGKTGLVDFLNEGQVGFGSTEFIVLRGKNGIKKEFVYCLARDEKFRRHCISSMVGSSGRQRVQHACFEHYFLAEASESILAAFRERVRPSFEKITENSRESLMLSELRDTLLPKLISGELAISDAEKLLESVE